MKIAFVGKGGAGKTALSSLFVRYLGSQQLPVVAIDADINQHLGVALGLTEAEAGSLSPLGQRLTELKTYLRGSNPRIESSEVMVKTTPPGTGSRLLQVGGDDPFHTAALRVNGALLLATGPFAEEDLGVACYHSKVGAVELYLNHLVDSPNEYIVVDMTAGADSFASGLFTRFDVTFLVVEPTRKGVSVYRQYRDYAADFDIKLRVIGNKVQDEEDAAFLRSEVGENLLTFVGQSEFVRALDRGRRPPFESLEADTLFALETIKAEIDNTPKDWLKFQKQMEEFHLRNAKTWANSKTGVDLADQIDPTFVMGPA